MSVVMAIAAFCEARVEFAGLSTTQIEVPAAKPIALLRGSCIALASSFAWGAAGGYLQLVER